MKRNVRVSEFQTFVCAFCFLSSNYLHFVQIPFFPESLRKIQRNVKLEYEKNSSG